MPSNFRQALYLIEYKAAPAYMWITELINGLITYSIAGAVIAIIYGKL